MILNKVTDLIGNTPMLSIPIPGKDAQLLLKIEKNNPGGSIKDRMARNMIVAALKSGRLRQGGVVVESSSGNTGIGLAFVAAVKGYRMILIMPDTMSLERRVLLKAFGAEIILTPGPKGMKAATVRIMTGTARGTGRSRPAAPLMAAPRRRSAPSETAHPRRAC